MERRNFAQVLKNAKIDIKREYERLYIIFYEKDTDGASWYDVCERRFLRMPFKGTYLSLKDFNKCNEFKFETPPVDFDINCLINFCEYIYNLVARCSDKVHFERSKFPYPISQINTLIEKIGYMEIEDDGFFIFVPKSQPAIIVSEMLPPDISYKVIEYNHHSMNGDLDRKRSILKLLADQLESRKDELKGINKQFKEDLFYMFNTISIRHNNAEKIKAISESKLEEWYDYVYELSLLAFMTLENSNHKQFVLDIKRELGDIQDH